MTVHNGAVQGVPGEISKATSIGSTKVPIGGGGCTPTLDLFDAKNERFSTLTGPTCFGGCLELCHPAEFNFSSETTTHNGNMGRIFKDRPHGCKKTKLKTDPP